jgi:hypothetical protein
MPAEKPCIELIQGDVLEFSADVLALKYAQHYYGADEAVSSRLIGGGVAGADQLQPAVWRYAMVGSNGLLPSPDVLFVGVPRLLQFNYDEIERFGYEAIAAIARERPHAKHVAMTLHGPGYGLDEVEALHSELHGIFHAMQSGNAPIGLRCISLLEHSAGRIERLRPIVAEANSRWDSATIPDRRTVISPSAPPAPAARMPGTLAQPSPPLQVPNEFPPPNPLIAPSPSPPMQGGIGKPRAFVAMPFAAEMEDVYFYGIQNPVRRLGFFCERIDQEAFTGEVLPQMRARIEGAEIVIADLTGANPNVYLEVGYAWGKARPTVLLVKEANELRFDVRGQRCLTYKSIKDLETQLIRELQTLTGRQAGD